MLIWIQLGVTAVCSASLHLFWYVFFTSVDTLLSAAQSFPNLNNSSNTSGGNTNSGQRQPSVLSLSQTMALSLTNSSDSEADFLDSCHAQVN